MTSDNCSMCGCLSVEYEIYDDSYGEECGRLCKRCEGDYEVEGLTTSRIEMEHFTFEVEALVSKIVTVEAEDADSALKLAKSLPIQDWEIDPYVPQKQHGPICDEDGYNLEGK